jgi:hypothetical protein
MAEQLGARGVCRVSAQQCGMDKPVGQSAEKYSTTLRLPQLEL